MQLHVLLYLSLWGPASWGQSEDILKGSSLLQRVYWGQRLGFTVNPIMQVHRYVCLKSVNVYYLFTLPCSVYVVHVLYINWQLVCGSYTSSCMDECIYWPCLCVCFVCGINCQMVSDMGNVVYRWWEADEHQGQKHTQTHTVGTPPSRSAAVCRLEESVES